jgi:hypothetical protein
MNATRVRVCNDVRNLYEKLSRAVPDSCWATGKLKLSVSDHEALRVFVPSLLEGIR